METQGVQQTHLLCANGMPDSSTIFEKCSALHTAVALARIGLLLRCEQIEAQLPVQIRHQQTRGFEHFTTKNYQANFFSQKVSTFRRVVISDQNREKKSFQNHAASIVAAVGDFQWRKWREWWRTGERWSTVCEIYGTVWPERREGGREGGVSERCKVTLVFRDSATTDIENEYWYVCRHDELEENLLEIKIGHRTTARP